MTNQSADPVPLKYVVLPHYPDAPHPRYETDGAACFDLRAAIPHPVDIEPGALYRIPSGLKFEIPAGFEMQVRPRSGLGFNYGVTFPNSPGTIDSDYRGEVMLAIQNTAPAIWQLGDDGLWHQHPPQVLTINPGDRIAQALLMPVPRVAFCQCNALSDTQRGTSGLGGTGVE